MREGDIGHLKVVILHDSRGDKIRVRTTDGMWLWVQKSDIVKIEERPIQVGDTVKFPQGAQAYTVKAIIEEHAMIKSNTGSYYVHPVDKLVRL